MAGIWLAVEEQPRLGGERFRVLEVRSVAGAGVEDQLCVGQVLLQDKGVDGGDDDVVLPLTTRAGWVIFFR